MEHRDESPDAGCETLDLRGLKCPLPVLRTRRALLALAPSRTIAVSCTDPLAGLDIPNLLRETGDVLIDTVREGRSIRFVIRKGPAPTGTAALGEDPSRRADVDHGNNRKAYNR